MNSTVQIRVDFAGNDGIPHTFLRVIHPDGRQVEYGLVPAKPFNVGRNSVSVLRRMSSFLSGAIHKKRYCALRNIITKKAPRFIRRIFSFAAIVFFGGVLVGWGEIYTDEGHALDRAMTRELISRGICKDFADCFDKLPAYCRYGNQVNFNYYDVKAKNRKALAIVIELVVSRGLEITGGAPIKIQVFPKPHEEYEDFKNFFSKKAIITLEVKK